MTGGLVEMGLATLIMVPLVSGFIAPEAERDNRGARSARAWVERRLMLIRRQLACASYMAGHRFTAAGVSVSYASNLGAKHAGFVLSNVEEAYIARTTGRDAYKRIQASHRSLT